MYPTAQPTRDPTPQKLFGPTGATCYDTRHTTAGQSAETRPHGKHRKQSFGLKRVEKVGREGPKVVGGDGEVGVPETKKRRQPEFLGAGDMPRQERHGGDRGTEQEQDLNEIVVVSGPVHAERIEQTQHYRDDACQDKNGW